MHIIPDVHTHISAGQSCIQVTPDVECSRPSRLYEFDISGEYADHHEQFHVLGSRPISLSVDVLWVNHNPVDLQPQWRSMADNTTSLHVRRYYFFLKITPYSQKTHIAYTNEKYLYYKVHSEKLRLKLVKVGNETIQSGKVFHWDTVLGM